MNRDNYEVRIALVLAVYLILCVIAMFIVPQNPAPRQGTVPEQPARLGAVR